MTDVGTPIPVARPSVGEAERQLVENVLSSGILALGPYTEQFELRLSRLTGRNFAVACSSGTAGLHLAVRGLGIGEGMEVITTPFSFIASANCILYERAKPVFVDIDEHSLGLDPERAEAAISSATRAILPVDVFGNPGNVDLLETVAGTYRLKLIEDACEALGSTLDGRALGSFGDAAVFGFYPNKQITTGEGGAVVTDDEALARRLRSLRNQGRDESAEWLRHVELGFNYRIDELSAALGVAQLDRLSELRAGRGHLASAYQEALAEIPWVSPPQAVRGANVDWFVYVVQFDPSIDRDEVMHRLASDGISTRPYFPPIHLQPFYRSAFGYRAGDFPVAERVAARTLALPFGPELPVDTAYRVAEALKRASRPSRPR